MPETNAEAKWYVLHTYAGYEKNVKDTLESIVEKRDLSAYIQQIEVPIEEYVEVKDNERKVKERKIFPSYVFAKLVMTGEIWSIVKNTRGVTGFVGSSGSNPVPLSDDELRLMGLLDDGVELPLDYEVGARVRIINGTLEGIVGTVKEINYDKKKVIVLVKMFDRETEVEVDHKQVIEIDN